MISEIAGHRVGTDGAVLDYRIWFGHDDADRWYWILDAHHKPAATPVLYDVADPMGRYAFLDVGELDMGIGWLGIDAESTIWSGPCASIAEAEAAALSHLPSVAV